MASNIFKIFGEIAINNSEANRSIDSTGTKAKNLSSGMKSEFDKIGKFALKLGKTVAVGMAGISTAIGALLKNSIDEFADKEQLEGGVETLFKDSAAKVKRYAANAYKTAGMSANQYMETVTSFSARLMQGLGDDTEAAAEMANLAITDMADNANKMGTDMASIQYAYQGFAKGNYTMLDNLKLGYFGTASEMARLINDSGVLGDTMTATADNVNSISFDTMIRAIHKVQTEMGITGTTAQEAEETISGSFNTMKSAWQNLISGLSTGDSKIAHIRRSDDFVESVKTWLSNIKKPILEFIDNLPDTVSEILPEVTSAALDIGSAIISEIYNGITGSEITSDDVKAAIQKVVDVGSGIGDNLGNAVENITHFLGDLLGWLDTNSVSLEEAIGIVTAAILAFKAATNPTGFAVTGIISMLIGIASNWDTIKEAVIAGWDAVKGFFAETIPNAALDVWNTITEKWEGIKSSVNGAWGNFKNFIKENVPESLLNALEAIASVWGTIASGINSAVNALSEFLGLSEKPVTIHEMQSGGIAGGGGLRFGGTMDIPGHASGLDFVPRDNYLARLHYGEAVLTHSEANDWRRGQKNGDGMNMEMLAEMITSAISERPIAINIDGKAFATIMSRQMSKAIGNRNIQQLMSMGG